MVENFPIMEYAQSIQCANLIWNDTRDEGRVRYIITKWRTGNAPLTRSDVTLSAEYEGITQKIDFFGMKFKIRLFKFIVYLKEYELKLDK